MEIDQLEATESFDNPVFISGDETVEIAIPETNNPKLIFNKKHHDVDHTVSFIQLFRFASKFDLILIITSLICAAASGICFPMTIIYYGEILDAFITKDFTDEEINTMRCNGTNSTNWPSLM